jgi:Na+-transporting NADH:ubiquinone oxidoreductase subunit NqrB
MRLSSKLSRPGLKFLAYSKRSLSSSSGMGVLVSVMDFTLPKLWKLMMEWKMRSLLTFMFFMWMELEPKENFTSTFPYTLTGIDDILDTSSPKISP